MSRFVIARSTLVRRSPPSGEGGCDDRVRRSSTSEGGSNPFFLCRAMDCFADARNDVERVQRVSLLPVGRLGEGENQPQLPTVIGASLRHFPLSSKALMVRQRLCHRQTPII